jgi:hypothetical protein
MEEYGPSITGEVHLSRQDGGYHVELYGGEGNPAGRTGLWRTEARAREKRPADSRQNVAGRDCIMTSRAAFRRSGRAP